MDMTGWHVLYLLWLTAGAMDFLLHRASSIESTSGLRENTLHLVQLAILGFATVLWLCFRASPSLLAILLVLVCLHAVTGYWDTRVAYPKRAIRPLEQHVHSILDIAPWIAAGAVYWYIPKERTGAELTFEPAPSGLWLFTIVPALLLTVIPAALEFRRCLAYRALSRRQADVAG
ncbi:hypothetical protein [Stenotrophomonas bentonitica]|uniref:hypothetical protein n=1 Tax=Stenotrophomonas bentonitica TaxID=1450134 RepID=UPI00345E5497